MVYTSPIDTEKKEHVAKTILHSLEKFEGGRTHARHGI